MLGARRWILLSGYRGRVGLKFVVEEDYEPHATMKEGDNGMDIGFDQNPLSEC